ncbi:hypothetical protein [Klebsiella quasipneumoniae]|uniref:hypothetical protein n=1 Tax=Klebsiella quasipneumoniae TaxID=1463165 RepID=UPI00389098AA
MTIRLQNGQSASTHSILKLFIGFSLLPFRFMAGPAQRLQDWNRRCALGMMLVDARFGGDMTPQFWHRYRAGDSGAADSFVAHAGLFRPVVGQPRQHVAAEEHRNSRWDR